MLLTVFKTEAVGLALETGFCLRVSVYLWSVFQEYTTLLQVGKVRGFIKVFNRRATEFDTRAKNWQGPEGLDP